MLIAYILFGVVIGMFAFVAACLLGASVLFALLVYVVVGAVAVVGCAIVHSVLTERGLHNFQRAQLSSDDKIGTAMRILVVDGDQDVLALISEVGSQLGYETVGLSGSVEQVLVEIERAPAPFDFLFINMSINHMDGIGICKKIRSFHVYRDSPIILLADQKDEDQLRRLIAVGASDYIYKPIDISDLTERLKAAQLYAAR